MRKIALYVAAAVAVVVMLIGDGIGIAAFLAHSKDAHPASHVAQKSENEAGHAPDHKQATRHEGTPHFVMLKKFVITLPHSKGGGQDYLQLAINFMTFDRKAIKIFKQYKPAVESAVTSSVMDQSGYFRAHPTKARQRLKKQALMIANRLVSQADGKLGKSPFAGAYVTDYVLQ